MRNSSRALAVAALAAALLLLLWIARHPTAFSSAYAKPAVASSTRSTSTVSTPPTGEASAPASTDRVDLVRRCLRLAETDPLAAMELAIAQKLTADDPGLLNALILRWADQDFSGALDWARAQPSDSGRDDILAHLAYLHSLRNPAAAAKIAATEIAAPHARAEAILSVAHQWAEQNPAAALAWSAHLADADLRRRVQDDIAATQTRNQTALSAP